MLLYGAAAWIFISLFVLVAHQIIYHTLVGNPEVHDRIYDRIRPYVSHYIPETEISDFDIEKAFSSLTKGVSEDTKISGSLLSDMTAEKLGQYGVEIPEAYRGIVEDALSNLGDGAETVGEIMEKLRKTTAEGAENVREKAIDAAAETATDYAILPWDGTTNYYLIRKKITEKIKLR